MSDDSCPANLHLIGGEMYAWSDLDTARGPELARGGALRHVVAGLVAPGATVLVAGPHHDAVIAALLAGGARVSWLCRSLPDAQRAAELFPAVTVLCGSLTKLDPAHRFQVVVAVDGLDRLDSAEVDGHRADAAVQVLAGAVTPGGALALLQDNPLGVQHSVELLPGRHHNVDAAWNPVFDDEDQRPASLAQLTERLAAEGLATTGAFAVYPTVRAPTVLIGRQLWGDTTSPLRGHIGAAVSVALTAAYRGRPVLMDPRRLVGRALRAGAEAVVAPGWLAIARRGPGGAPPERGWELLVGEVDDPHTYELTVRDGQPELTVLVPPGPRAASAGMLPVTDLPAYPGAAGRLFDERLLQLCAAADLGGLRTELARFVDWVGRQARDGLVTGPAALATAATVFDDGYGLSLAPPRWQPAAGVAERVVVLRACWLLAVDLVTSGRPHPWGLSRSAADLTAILVALVGRTPEPDELRAAIDLQVAYDTAERQLTLSEQQAHRVALLGVQPGTPPIDVPGYHELAETVWRQRYQSSHLLAMLDWTEQIIRSRDYWHSRMDWEIQLFRRTWGGRMLLLGRSGYRTLRRDVRAFLRELNRLVRRRRRRR